MPRLQDELKQTKPFDRPEDEAFLSVLRTSALLEHALRRVLKPFGLTPAQYNVLRILRGAGQDGLCGREIGERLVAPVPDVSRLLDRMTGRGLVARTPDPEDHRQVRATLTDDGRALLERATRPLGALQERWMGAVDDARLRDLIETLARVRGRQG